MNKKLKLRPGPGWKYLGGGVYEHDNKTRMHMLGMIRLPNGEFLSANTWPESKDLEMMIRINGGSRKRGLMAFALKSNAMP